MSTADDTITTGTAPRVVAGVNDSAPARAALRWAIGWAGHTGARGVAIAAWEPLIPVVAGPEIGAEVAAASMPTDEQLQDQAGHWLDDAIAALPAGAEQVGGSGPSRWSQPADPPSRAHRGAQVGSAPERLLIPSVELRGRLGNGRYGT